MKVKKFKNRRYSTVSLTHEQANILRTLAQEQGVDVYRMFAVIMDNWTGWKSTPEARRQAVLDYFAENFGK